MNLGKFQIENLYSYGAFFYAFLIPFPQKWTTIGIGVWVILSLISFKKENTFKNMWLLFPVLIYSTYIIGHCVSPSVHTSFLVHKLSLLIFPLLFFLHRYHIYQLNQFVESLIYGLIFSGIALLLLSCYHSFDLEDGRLIFEPSVLEGKSFIESVSYGGNYFFGEYFSVFHQTVYYALYLCSGIAYLLFSAGKFSMRNRVIIITFFFTLLFLVSNKAAFLVMLAILSLKIITSKIKVGYKILGAGIVLVWALLFTVFNPRMQDSVQKLSEIEYVLDKNAKYGFSVRLLCWDAAKELIEDRPLTGYGGGNAQSELNRIYQQKEYNTPLKQHLNAHNAFMQIWIENGIVGFVAYLSLFIALVFLLIKGYGPISAFIIALILILFMNSMFESILNRFSGVSFFAFITCFMISMISSMKGGQSET